MEQSKKEEIIKRISSNITYLLEKSGYSQNELSERIFQKRGIKYDQTYISNIKTGKINHIPAVALTCICEELNTDMAKIMWENLNSESLVSPNSKIKKQANKLIYISKNEEFEQYLGQYYCYFFPTISSETNDGLIEANLNFDLHPQTKECIAKFNIETTSLLHDEDQEKICKEYKGRLIISDSYHCCYSYLVNDEFGEMSFMIFDKFQTNQNPVLCRMAIVLTPSAGGTRDATCHRMFISKKKLSSKGISFIKPHLKMNSAEMLISENNLSSFFEDYNVPEKFQYIIKNLSDPEKYYRIREEHFFGFDSRHMLDYNKEEFITKLREYTYAKNYQKIGAKVDKLLFQELYKSLNTSKYFTNEK